MTPRFRYLISVCLASIATAWGQQIPESALDRLLSNADAVVIGTATARTQAGTDIRLSLDVANVLKGGITAGTQIPAQFQSSIDMPFWGSSTPAPTGIWFLKTTLPAATILQVRPGHSPGLHKLYLPAVQGGNPPANVSTARERIVYELAAAATKDEAAALLLLDLIAAPQTDAEKLMLNQLLASPGLLARSVAFVKMIATGSSSAICQVEATLKAGFDQRLVGHLARSLELRLNPNDVAGLACAGHVAANSDVPAAVRLGAAGALQALHTKQAVPYLAALLDSPDEQVRNRAILGISSFANGLPSRGSDGLSMGHLTPAASSPFRTEETLQFLGLEPGKEEQAKNFWKSWWIRNQALLKN